MAAASLTASVAQALPVQPREQAVAPDGAGVPAYAVNGEVVHFNFQWSDDNSDKNSMDRWSTPNTIPGGPKGLHHNGAYVDRAQNWSIWGNPAATPDGRTLRLDGSNQYVSVPLTLPGDQSFTVSSWVQLTQAPGKSYSVISQDGGRVSGFYLKVNPDGKPVFGMPRGDSENTGWDTANGPDLVTQAFPDTMKPNWTHLTGVYDAQAGEVRLYVNGVLTGRAPHTSTWQANGEIALGRAMWAGQHVDYLPGGMADVRIWRRALNDLEAANVAIPDGQVRGDRCTLGNWLHAGGPKVKALTSTALNGTGADARWTSLVAWGYGPVPAAMLADEADQRAANQAQYARSAAWAQVTKPFAPLSAPGDDYQSFLNPPDYGKEMRDFLLDDGKRNWDGPPVAKPSQASLDRALAIAKQHRDAETSGPYYWSASDDALNKLSAYQIARFIRFGGLPATAPARNSVEFRTEVEDLKAQWAGCDGSDPLDPNHVLDDVVATASAEWQAEQTAQAKQRADIAAADIQAYQDVRTASDALVEAQGQAYVVSRMLYFQQFYRDNPGLSQPGADQFAQATQNMADAQAAIGAQLTVAQQAATSAKAQADKASAAEADAGAVAAANGTPYARGLTYARQSAQVVKASAAAAQAAAKAIETTLNAVAAGQSDSKALYALGDAQIHATQAEFQRAAAQEAADQAHNAAATAAAQADQAAKNADRAKADRATAEQAESDAKSAADDAHARRATAEAEQAKAAAARQQADAQRAQAQQAEAQAKDKQQAAQAADATAQADAATAAQKRAQAEGDEATAARGRDAAVQAEGRRDALAARAGAADAVAASADSDDAASAARQAATGAHAAADQAAGDAKDARAAADTATKAAIASRQAATEAAGAAAKSKAASDAAAADVAVAIAAATTAHAAAADAVSASAQSAQNAKNAQAQADTAAANAAQAKAHATAAGIEADHTQADAARAAGQAYAAAQYADAARDAANAAIASGTTAIALGTPFRESDSSAGLAVLLGQDSKTLAQQQADVAKARADEAARAAQDAAALAANAAADAQAAAQLAAGAAADAAQAANSAAQALASAAQAATDAGAAKTSDARTSSYANQAGGDSLAAYGAATTAARDAAAANGSATEAEKDAAGAHKAADAATSAADHARGAANQASKDADAAQQAAANARQSAEQAQQAAQKAEAEQDRATVTSGGATGVGQMFTQQKIDQLGDPKPENPCVLDVGARGCDVTFTLHYKVTVDFYLCVDPSAGPDVTAATCPADHIVWLGTNDPEEKSTQVQHHFSTWELTKILDKAVLQGLWKGLTDDFAKCSHGSVGGCAMAGAVFVPGNKILEAAKITKIVRDAVAASRGIDEALVLIRETLNSKAITKEAAASLSYDLAHRASELARFKWDADPKLIAKLQKAGVNFSRKDLLWVTETPKGDLVFLETGEPSAGLVHVLGKHGGEFVKEGIPVTEVPEFIRTTVSTGKIVDYQGRDLGRPIFLVTYKGVERRVAITIGSNGFVVGANLA